MKKILFIDDDTEYARMIIDLLKELNYNVDYSSSSIEGLEMAKKINYDLVIADLYLDKLNGNQIAEMLKVYREDAKVIILTNSTNPSDEVRGLQVGVDDYVKKDVSFEILVERIKRLIQDKKTSMSIKTIKSDVEQIKIDRENRIVKKDDVEVHLTMLEFDLLVYLLKNKNQLLSREQIIEKVWKVPADSLHVDLRTVDAHIKNLRSKLALSSIVSVRGIGYRWHE
ncbi:two-component system response regulator VanR [Bacilli bacterium PM5-3]|nr:two-component system response regulator VanR [Bacilli bacterium PM5-3]MDH6604018.1 two-component system response regulator VanR [Bacilli bacterium PM5-9]